MKTFCRTVTIVTCACLIAVPCIRPVSAQQADEGRQVFDKYSTVIGAVYPVAGSVFKATGEMLNLFGYFGKSADPVGDSIKLINARLNVLEKRIAEVENDVARVSNRQLLAENRDRIRFLKDRRQELEDLTDELKQRPTEPTTKLAQANKARRIAGRFLDDPGMDIWTWSDMRDRDRKMLPAEFKPLPALEYYVLALVTWITAIENASDGNYEVVKGQCGELVNTECSRDLRKHIAFLSVRPDWSEGGSEPPVSLPENIRSRISCSLQLLHSSPNAITRKCVIEEFCKDELAREWATIASHEEVAPVGTEICNLPFSAKKIASEEELERGYGIEIMEKLAQKLKLILETGTARENYIGTFDPSTQTADYLYGVKANGELLWYRHRIVTYKTGGASSPPAPDSPTAPTRPHDFPGGNNDPRIQLPPESGTFAKTKVVHSLDGPKPVGKGWDSFLNIIPAGLSIIYTVRPDGELLWYRHDGFLDGTMNWTGYKDIGRGWSDSKQIVPMGDGIIYTITHDGHLEWRRHVGYLDGRGLETAGAWEGPRVLGKGWGDFKFVFAGGEGVIYAVTNAGDLRWYRNKNFMTGVDEWEGPNIIGNGWESFKMVFSTGEGSIYAMKPTGELVWYKHEGYLDGTKRWQAPVQVAADWSDFIFVFPSMKGTYVPPIVR